MTITPPPSVGGNVALDFSNTVAWRLRDGGEERLPTYAALVAWAREAETLSAPRARQLLRAAARNPAAARRALHRARALREAIFQVGASLGHKHAPGGGAAAAAIRTIHEARVRALRSARLAWIHDRYDVTWDEHTPDVDRAWWPVAVAAAELLESNELSRVRMCAGAGCGWLFLDHSRNNSRRWCASGDCGNRARVDRFRARQRRNARR